MSEAVRTMIRDAGERTRRARIAAMLPDIVVSTRAIAAATRPIASRTPRRSHAPTAASPGSAAISPQMPSLKSPTSETTRTLVAPGGELGACTDDPSACGRGGGLPTLTVLAPGLEDRLRCGVIRQARARSRDPGTAGERRVEDARGIQASRDPEPPIPLRVGGADALRREGVVLAPVRSDAEVGEELLAAGQQLVAA